MSDETPAFSRSYKRRQKIDGVYVAPVEVIGPAVIDLVRGGISHPRAAEAMGLERNAISKWIRRGLAEQRRLEEGQEPDEVETPYLEFLRELSKAEAEAQSGLVLSWYKEARQGDWKAAERFLAKRWPQEWGDDKTVKLEVTAGAQVAEPQGPPEDDEQKKRQILEALVEAGDLPANVLGAWDSEEVIDVNEVVETPAESTDEPQDS